MGCLHPNPRMELNRPPILTGLQWLKDRASLSRSGTSTTPIRPPLSVNENFTAFSLNLHTAFTKAFQSTTMKTLLSAIGLLSLILATPGFAQKHEIKNAQVTIPYTELRKILETAQRFDREKESPKPPVEATLRSAKYHLDLSDDQAPLNVDFEVRTFTDGWHSLPLWGGDPRLDSMTPDDATSVVRTENTYSFIAKGPGDFPLSMALTLPNQKKWQTGGGLRFSPAAATRSELHVTGLPTGMVLRIDNLPPTRANESELVFHLPGDGKELKLYLEEGSATTEAPPIQPSLWNIDSQVLARYRDGRIHHSARIQAQAQDGSGLSLLLALPANAARITLESEDLADWKLKSRTEDSRLLEINWETRDTLDRTIELSWETPQSPLAESWTLTPPRTIPQKTSAEDSDEFTTESRSLIALVPVDGLELTHPTLQSAIESRRLPEWLQDQLGASDSLTAEINDAVPIRLQATWLPRMETAQATISQATFDTRLVADGSSLVTAVYTIQHAAPLSWKLTLPSSDQILTCEVNGEATKPIQRADGEIEFRLPSPRSLCSEEGQKIHSGTRINICYSLKSDAFDPVSGRVAMELPETSLFIHRLDWALVLPDLYEPTAVEGNVQLSTESSKSEKDSNRIQLKKELCRGERPTVEIYYQRKNLTTQS